MKNCYDFTIIGPGTKVKDLKIGKQKQREQFGKAKGRTLSKVHVCAEFLPRAVATYLTPQDWDGVCLFCSERVFTKANMRDFPETEGSS